jgi:hypothetical protein
MALNMIQIWETKEYQSLKKETFELVSNYLKTPPTVLLDIGCGLAWESRMFNENFGTELWLLDGNQDNNDDISDDRSFRKYHKTADTFKFYQPLENLKTELDKMNTQNYHLVDADNIIIPNNLKFNLITSYLSCGFHYPVSTYRNLILKHSDSNTKIIMTLRTSQADLEENINIVSIIKEFKKCILAEIKVS